MTVEKKDIDWGSLGFGYMKTDYSYEAHWKDGEWDEGGLTTDHTLHVSECGGIFHYCQEVFEGLKAYTAEDGSIVCFRPDMNAERMYNSAQRLEMPPFPKDKFVEAVKQVVSANAAWVPPFGSGATLYVRPFMIGSGDVIGVAPAPEYTFRILVTPVGPYFKGGLKPVKLRVSEYDRAAPHGTGNIKAGLNYAMSLKPTMEAHREGYAENLYLDSESRTYVEETGGANVLFVKEDGTLVVALGLYGPLFEKAMSNVIEVKARGASVLALATESHRAEMESRVDGILTIPDTELMFLPLLGVVPLQLFAYYVALQRGCDIDKPRNLAKSVTVE